MAGLQEEFNTWRVDLETRLRGNELPPAMEAVLAKHRSLIPALALLIHLADHAESGPVCYAALLKALAWGEYLESHARRIYGKRIDTDLGSAIQLAGKIQDGYLPERFTAREVYRPNWSQLNSPKQAQAAIQVLIDHNWLCAEPESAGPSGGRPQIRYRINPKVRQG